jgi:hypothetical protein
MFTAPTTQTADPGGAGGHLIVYSLRELPDELHAIGTLLALDAIWRRVTDPHHRARRLVTVDEAWLLLQHQAGATFLHRLAKITSSLIHITQHCYLRKCSPSETVLAS